MWCTGDLNMLHTVLGQVAPTFLLPPWSHDLSPGSRIIHHPFPDPFCSHINITEGQTRGPMGCAHADKKRTKQKQFIFSVKHTLYLPTHTYKPTPPHPSPCLTYPGQAAAEAAARGAGAEGSNPQCRSHRQGSLS